MDKRINILTNKEVKEIIYRTGEALPLREKTPVRLTGIIDTPRLWLEKRKDTFHHTQSYIKINKSSKTITLTINEEDYCKTIITGQLSVSDEFDRFQINTGTYFTNFEMADLIRMSRSYFSNRDVAMRLVSELRNFKAKIDKEVEKTDNTRGDRRLLIAQTVESNLPEKFSLNIPLFRGMRRQEIEVEVDIRADDMACTLVSPHAQEAIDDNVTFLIEEQIQAIRGIAPNIVIVEV